LGDDKIYTINKITVGAVVFIEANACGSGVLAYLNRYAEK
jgi:hypothetical protein